MEYDGWVYDPVLMYKLKKRLYYKMHVPKNRVYRRSYEYKKHKWYQDIVNTTIDDLRPGGKDRGHLCVSIPLIQGIADASNNKDFINELEQYLKLIEYDYNQVVDELKESITGFARKRT